jgi:hypothetical protein
VVTSSAEASAGLLKGAAGDLEVLFGSLGELAGATADLERSAEKEGRRLRRQDVVSVRPLIKKQLRRHDALVAGTGVLMRPGLLEDVPMFVEWWCAGSPEPFLLRVSLDPEHAIFSDYDTFEWFAEPWAAGSRRIVGPWVDYTGTGEHVLTLSVPIFGSDDEFLGVAGADVLARQLEEIAIRALREIPRDAALINADGRVIASNTSRLLVGSLLEEDDARWASTAGRGWTVRGDGLAASRDAQLPWAVVVFQR